MKAIWKQRFSIERALREELWARDFQETRTPLLVESPGIEPHILPMRVKHPREKLVFLPTSPEFAMKKLLAQGLPKIFQISSAFRDEPESKDHHPEFSMLEIYQTHCSLTEFQEEIENLLYSVAHRISKKSSFLFRDTEINFSRPWPRYRIVDLFLKALNLDLRENQTSVQLAAHCKRLGLNASPIEPWDDLYFKLWLNFVESTLPQDRPCFVTHYPVSQSSLCNRSRDETGFEWANRFEIYVGALELGNAFDELRDPKTQRENFVRDLKFQKEIHGEKFTQAPFDEEFLIAIEKMPPTCGIAIGLDRFCMLLLGAKTIDEVIPLKSFWADKD